MVGFVGQQGWTHRADGKANAMRTSADPVLYICPSTSVHAQLVFNLRSFTINVVRSVQIAVDPFSCALLLAGSALHQPSGAAASPALGAYEARLNALLVWQPVADPGSASVLHDHLTGMPHTIVERTPLLTSDGTLVMLGAGDLADAAATAGAAMFASNVREGNESLAYFRTVPDDAVLMTIKVTQTPSTSLKKRPKLTKCWGMLKNEPATTNTVTPVLIPTCAAQVVALKASVVLVKLSAIFLATSLVSNEVVVAAVVDKYFAVAI
jgi:hypothetical protein